MCVGGRDEICFLSILVHIGVVIHVIVPMNHILHTVTVCQGKQVPTQSAQRLHCLHEESLGL